MKQFIKNFLKTGLMASVGGPIILAIIYWILGSNNIIQTLTFSEVVKGILTSSLLAFIAGGIGRIYEIEQLPLFIAAVIHGIVLYLDYILIYLFNGWIKNQLTPILVFTAIFIVGYLIVWIIIYFTTKKKTKKINAKLNA